MSGFVPGETPEGWYADPQSAHPGAQRWWNGVQWTAHTRQPESTRQPEPTPPPHTPPPHTLPAHVPTATPPIAAASMASPAGQGPEELFVSRTVDGQTMLGLPSGVPVHTAYGARVAPAPQRLLAWLVDTGIVAIVSAVLTLPIMLVVMAVSSLVLAESVTLGLAGTPFWATAIAVCWGYHAIGLTSRGASVGQRTMGLGVRPWKVNGRLTRRQVLLRSALMTVTFVGGLVGGPALGLVAFGVLASTVVTGSTRRGIHEVWTDTCTVHVR